MQKITVVGAGVSGRALALFAVKNGAQVFVTDTRPELPSETQELFMKNGIAWEAGVHSPRCCECDLMLVSSGVNSRSPAVIQAFKRGIPVQGELDFLAPHLSGKLIAVTGTNGKTTCTSLIGHLLKSNGLDAVTVGNIGDPIAAHAGEKHDAFVMELSSFQLSWNTRLAPDVAVLTNLESDHINWHGSFEKYVEDKCKVFLSKPNSCAKSGSNSDSKRNELWAILHACDADRVPAGRAVCAIDGKKSSVFDNEGVVTLNRNDANVKLFEKKDLKLLGTHNLENAIMSTAAVALSFPQLAPDAGLSSFKPPRHRCEKVCVKNGVLYVDDSKGTNVAAVVTALHSIAGHKVIILGGQGKGETYEKLTKAVKEKAFAAIVLGSEAEKILDSLHEGGYTNTYRVADMSEAVKKSAEIAQGGDIVLLSPACASWDMYPNYEERGNHFAALVNQLP